MRPLLLYVLMPTLVYLAMRYVLIPTPIYVLVATTYLHVYSSRYEDTGRRTHAQESL
jgi:hypothetical protein